VAETDSVLKLLERLPPRPAPALDRLLDATERCLARYGIRRTSMTDIARELHVARTTLYRHVGSVEEAVALVASRQLHRFLDDLLGRLSGPGGASPAALHHAVVEAVRFARSHPVSRRVLEDEPEILGSLLARDLRPYATQVAEALAPVLSAAGNAVPVVGDPLLAAQWLVRVVAVLVVLPPEGDLEAMAEYALGPLLGAVPTARGQVSAGPVVAQLAD
jgi:AcrR family transcriptional regulator